MLRFVGRTVLYLVHKIENSALLRQCNKYIGLIAELRTANVVNPFPKTYLAADVAHLQKLRLFERQFLQGQP